MPIPIGTLLAGAIGGIGSAMIFPPFANLIRQTAYKIYPNELIPYTDMVEAAHRGIIDKGRFIDELRKQGFNTERAEIIFKAYEQLFTVTELLTLYRRGVMSWNEVIDEGKKIGWTADKLNKLLIATEARPSPTDVISMAVKDVYTPEIAEYFGQYEGADEVYEKAKKDLEAAGVSKEIFRRYWASHWELPSVEAGYEMLHRGIITMEDLEKLMRARDVMPFWRDKLLKISYAPYTRVDIRRMHKLGILTDEELVQAYMDIGYDREKAEKMAQFTILYNANPDEQDQNEIDKTKAKERDLTKNDILDGYEMGLLTEDETRESLVSLGYTDDEIDYYIQKIVYKQHRKELDTYIKLYREAYIKGIMSYNDTVDALGKLDLPSEMIERLFREWDIERLLRTNKPTKAEILTFVRKGLMTKEEAKTELANLGYEDKYVELYLATV